MKINHLIIGAILITPNAYAVLSGGDDLLCCYQTDRSCTNYDSTCQMNSVNSNCDCQPSTTTSNGVVTTTNYYTEVYCVGSTNYARCTAGTPSYSCASGYYGTATSATAGCTKCPSNATCAGGNGSTFVCNKGYYKSGTSCTACESPGTTSGAGATSKSECCLSSNSFSDSIGSGTYTSSCCQS